MKNYVEYVKEFIIERLPEYEGIEVCMCELGYKITEDINVDGSATYNENEAMEYISEWFYEAGEVIEYQENNYGKVMYNPFKEPEKFMVCMIIEGVNVILSENDVVNENWNDEIELTEEIIENIVEYVKKIKEINF